MSLPLPLSKNCLSGWSTCHTLGAVLWLHILYLSLSQGWDGYAGTCNLTAASQQVTKNTEPQSEKMIPFSIRFVPE